MSQDARAQRHSSAICTEPSRRKVCERRKKESLEKRQPKKKELTVFGKAHATNVKVEDHRCNLEEGSAKEPVFHTWRSLNCKNTRVTDEAILHGLFMELERLTKHFKVQTRWLLAVVGSSVRAIVVLLDVDAIDFVQEFLDFVVRACDQVGAGVENGVFNLVSIKLDCGPPVCLVCVLVRPSDEAAQLKEVDLADIERGFLARAHGELIGAGLDQVLLLGSPHERFLFDIEAPGLSSGEGEAKGATGFVTIKVLFTVTDGNVPCFDASDATNAYFVSVNVTIDMETIIREVEFLVEILGGKRFLGIVRIPVENQIGRTRVEHDIRLLGREADLDLARVILIGANVNPAIGALLLVHEVQVDNV